MKYQQLMTLVRQLKDDTLPSEQVRASVTHPSNPVRALALNAIARREDEFPDAVDIITNAAADPENSTAILVGLVTVTHEAIACLLRIGSPVAISSARRLIEEQPESEKEILVWFLSEQSLLPDNRESNTNVTKR